MAAPIKVSDAVALTQDLPANNLQRGQVGQVSRVLSDGTCQVDFKDKNGRIYAALALRAEQLLRLHYEPVSAQVPTQPPASSSEPSKIAAPPGISGQLTLESGKTTFRVGEDIWFIETLVNATSQPVKYSFLGVNIIRSDGQKVFHTSWSGDLFIGPGCTGPTDSCGGPWRDRVTIADPGEYQLTMDANFSDQESARKGIGWAALTTPIPVTVVR